MRHSISGTFLSVILLICFILSVPGYAAGTPSNTARAMLSAGNMYTLMLKSDGTVWAWGFNDQGQLGDGTTKSKAVPVQVKGLMDIISISAGRSHAVALKKDGTVWTWGTNTYGELGDGTSKSRSIPAPVKGLSGITAISSSCDYSTAALAKDGTVWTWGRNNAGQLGDGTKSNRRTPVRVKGLTNVIAVSAGGGFTVALKKDGTVWSWGSNRFGQLGNESSADFSLKPVQAKNLTGVTEISAGACYATALKKDGTVWAWGINYAGQLGMGYEKKDLGRGYTISEARNSDQNAPVRVAGMTDVTGISSKDEYTVAVRKDGTVWAWGYNYYGQLGDGSRGYQNYEASQVEGLHDIKAVSAGISHTVAVQTDGTVWAWGNNWFGSFGNGVQTSALPVKAKNLTGITNIEAERLTVTAFKNDGTAWAWGNGYGTVPVEEGILNGAVAAINQGGLFVLKADGTVWARTDSDPGNKQTSGGSPLAGAVLSQAEGLTDVVSICPGDGWRVMALKKDGTVWKFENNLNREGWFIGPVEQVKELTDIRSMCSAFYDGVGQVNAAVKNDGTVWTWEDINPSKCIPSRVAGLSEIISACAGNTHFAALKKDGTVWTWGSNLKGQLGDNTYEREKPAMVKGLSDITAIAAGEAHTLALKRDGTVWAWGDNFYGQLGNGGHMSGSSKPVQVKGITNAVKVFCSQDYSVVLTKDGAVWVFGDNYYGQHGDGTEIAVCKPVPTGILCK